MGDQFVVNAQAPSPEPQEEPYVYWHLIRTMIAAGWEVWGSSTGSAFGSLVSTTGTDYWTGFSTSGGVNNDNWIALKRPGADDGWCFHSLSSTPLNASAYTNRSFRLTKTTTNWSATGVSATVAPLAVGTTHYVVGTASGGQAGLMGYNQSTQTLPVPRYNIWVRDAATDGGWGAWAITDGENFTRILVNSSIDPATASSVGDRFVVYGAQADGTVIGNDPTNMFAAAFWRIVGPDNVLSSSANMGLIQLVSAGVYLANIAAKDTYTDPAGTVSYLERFFVASASTDSGVERAAKGFANDLRFLLTPGARWDMFDARNWVKLGNSSGGLIVPWDGVTTTVLTS